MKSTTMIKAAALVCASLAVGCGEARTEDGVLPTVGDAGGDGGDTGGIATTGADDGDDDEDTGERYDVGGGEPPVGGCNGDSDCELIDVLFVIDNSGTMGEEQLNLAANFPLLVERLQNLETGGVAVNADVNIMVTTTDFGHPLCTDFQREGYAPAQGSPIFTGCNERIDGFSTPSNYNKVEIPEACTDSCPADVVPGGDPFIHFGSSGTNVPGGDVSGALSCVGPQGIDGCGYEAPLETMLQSLRPEACWNDPSSDACKDDEDWSWVSKGFLRPGSTLAIAIITDEADCSVKSPDGFSYFTNTDNDEYWLEDPAADMPMPSSAICWNAGVKCTDDDDDGVYESCTSREDNPALHPVSRYTEFLEYLEGENFNDIVMLGVLGVPPVTGHSEQAPFQPTEGGVAALEYRDWKDGEYDGTDAGGDILPGDWNKGVTAAEKQFEFGIGPGCTGKTTITIPGEDGGEDTEEEVFTGQAVPPVRIREVCESLNTTDASGNERIRCCIESICDDDFSPAIDCLTGIIAETFTPVG